jgi:hypothetical protein
MKTVCPCFLAILGMTAILLAATKQKPTGFTEQKATKTYLGFDRNLYPGDDALPVLRKNFSFAGYWLGPPPGERANSWAGKRALLLAHGFGLAVLVLARPQSELKTADLAIHWGTDDGRKASAAARAEGFGPRTIIFLDLEEGGRLSTASHAYLGSWMDELGRDGYRAGVYCSGMPVSEGRGISITTADDIKNHIGRRDLTYWIYNDACPPSPGCVKRENPPLPAASGLSRALIWQFAQSPRRKEFTARCAASYYQDNCYADDDSAHQWFLDLDTAAVPDPSAAGRP